MAEVDISVTIKISIPNTERLKERIKEEYEEVTDETVLKFIEDNIEAHNTCGGLFLVEGSSADTTGCLINEIDLDELTEGMDDK